MQKYVHILRYSIKSIYLHTYSKPYRSAFRIIIVHSSNHQKSNKRASKPCITFTKQAEFDTAKAIIALKFSLPIYHANQTWTMSQCLISLDVIDSLCYWLIVIWKRQQHNGVVDTLRGVVYNTDTVDWIHNRDRKITSTVSHTGTSVLDLPGDQYWFSHGYCYPSLMFDQKHVML